MNACTSDACRQGRDACPTPDACWLDADDDDLAAARGIVWCCLASSLLMVGVIAVCVALFGGA